MYGVVTLNGKTIVLIRSCKGFQKFLSCSISLMLTLTWGTDILFDKFRSETGGLNLKNTLCTMPSSLGWDFMQSLSSFLISLVVIRTLMS